MNARRPAKEAPSKFDASTIIRVLLGYEDYWHLMVLLFVFGIMSGVAYYVYARATFESTALVRVNQFIDPARVAQGGSRSGVDSRLMRSLIQQLASGYYILETGKALGVAGDRTTYDDLRSSAIPAVRIGVLDQNHLEIRVVAFKPKIVREFSSKLLETYESAKVKQRQEFREKAIKRYVDELASIRQKLTKGLDNRLKFEEESALASAQIEFEKLSSVPVDLVRLKYRLESMEQIHETLQAQESTLGVVGQLALLTSLPKDETDSLASGRIVRRGEDAGSTPIQFQSPATKKEFTQVVVQPDMVEGIESWQELEKEKRGLEEKIRITRLKFLDDHPEMIKLIEQQRQVESALNLELEVARKAFDLELERVKEQIRENQAKLPKYYQAIKDFDGKKLEYEMMQNGQLAWDKAYGQLAKQIEGFQFEADESSFVLEFRGFLNIKSESPASPSKSKLIIMGCLLGLGLAGGVPFILRRMNSAVSDLNEFEMNLGIPGIGLVPLSDPRVLEEVNRSPTIGSTTPNALLENFRLIRSSILLNHSPKGEARVIMLSSARPGEGKTTVSANVAWAFSSMGEKTILLDCDLRRGRLHSVADVPNRPGMTDLLTGSVALKDCVCKSTADNLWVIPRGPVLPGTTELLNSPAFAAIIEQLKKDYDRIVLDTPPVLGLSETAFLQSHADGIVLVVKAGVTGRRDVEDAFHALQKLGGHFYGFVLNGVDFSKKINHYQYYYYSSSYYDSNWEAQEGEGALPEPTTASGSKAA